MAGHGRGAGAVAIAVALSAAACDGAAPEQSEPADAATADAVVDPCAAVVNSAFRTVDEHECGLGPDGPVFCKYWILFDAGSYEWQHGDVSSAGDYTCDEGVLESTTAPLVSGAYDPQSDLLVWDGLTYERSL